MNNKKKAGLILKILFVVFITYSAVKSASEIVFPIEAQEVEVCIDFDELLNYCNEFEIQEKNTTSVWLNVFLIITAVLVLSIWIPKIKRDIREYRYGFKANWDER